MYKHTLSEPHFKLGQSKSTLSQNVQGQSSVCCVCKVCLPRKVQEKGLSVLRNTKFASTVYNPLHIVRETVHCPTLVTIAHLAMIHFCISPVSIYTVLISNHMNLPSL
ncbi:hypothetical protein PR048_025875 [Dryococelus australis]|uniref:Uncharacterized protein n=1 Tax=Dryococelus australis TaxID=614101 RepID=A0ABQ9GJU1_9NEOP|nr:hypothetical protein PR048_025875 [Dryococelus australis]